jgi:hypothetical protein
MVTRWLRFFNIYIWQIEENIAGDVDDDERASPTVPVIQVSADSSLACQPLGPETVSFGYV